MTTTLCPYDGQLFTVVPGYFPGLGRCPVCKGVLHHVPVEMATSDALIVDGDDADADTTSTVIPTMTVESYIVVEEGENQDDAADVSEVPND